jgi:predicted methyltransferase
MMRSSSTILLSLALGSAAACKKKESPPPPSPSSSSTAAGDAGAAATPTEAERAAAALTKAEADAATEAQRWTAELEQQAIALRDREFADTRTALATILASPHRVPGHADRDAARHPIETLEFFGVTPTSTVVELGAGGGWYSELLAPLLYTRGKLIVAGPDANGPADKMATVYGKRLDLFLAKSPGLFGKVDRVTISSPDTIELGAAGSAHVVLAIREMHGWQNRSELSKYLAAVHAVLAPGGTFGVIAHRAAPGAKVEDTSKQGYLPEDFVIEQVKAAGFELAEKSEINANPRDTKDYPKGVWTLPPNLREGETDRAKYTAIGESDRMTLKFVKPTAK